MIKIEGVSKSYGQINALQSIDLMIPPGMTSVFIGPSGCGKSTLLRLAIGLIQADRGSVYFEGTKVTPEVVVSLRRKMGYVIQEGGIFPHLTAHENVALMARYIGWDDERIKERLKELADLTHFPPDGLGRFPVQLSGGQQQRVSLMRALMLDPDVLLLDEPLGALDPMIRADLQMDLKRIFQTLNKTVVLVTHDIAEACFFGNVITLLRDGRLLQKGTLEELMHSPADPFVTRFINAQQNPFETIRKKFK
ncbi:MAG: ATP-binding cassette domain-containing protein [Planctomycetota bacterium]|jgi:osmoprotectant transport system ATP-binding protein